MPNLSLPSPRTWSVGDLLTSALFNILRDSFLFLLNVPMFRGHQSAGQSILNATWTQLTLDVADIDTYTGWVSGTNTRYTSQLAGFYEVFGVNAWAANATGIRGSAVTVNGAAVGNPNATYVTTTSVSGAHAPFTDLIYLNVGDYISLWGYQSSGGALATLATGSRLVATWKHA